MSEEEGCLSLTILGRYRVRVFDWQPNGERSDKSAYDEFMDLTEGTAREFSLAVQFCYEIITIYSFVFVLLVAH